MQTDAIDEDKAADLFMRQCITHISNASDVQKTRLLRTLLERPPEHKIMFESAINIWNGLDEKEIMQLLGHLQKQFDRDTWEFMSRWR
jgi:hypothetical protein